MPKKDAPEFSYNPKTGLYRKKIKAPSGRWIPIYGHTKQELRDKIRDREEDFARGILADEDPELWQYAARWFQNHTADLSAKRKEDYRNAINNHICPVIGTLHVREVRYSDIMEVMAGCADLSRSGQSKVATALRRIFEAAVKDHIIAESPCADLKAGGDDAAEKIALTRAQQKTLTNALAGHSILPFVMLCLYAGLRREEALGLRWDHVDLSSNAPHIDVRGACNWDGKNKPRYSELLKSDAAYRSIPIPPQLLACLQALRGGSTSDYVISNRSGEMLSATGFRRRWDAIRVRTVREIKVQEQGKPVTKTLRLGDEVRNHRVRISLDFHVTPHLLRHTYISELILAGVSVKRVQYLAGHKSPIITLRIYTHLMENRPEDLIDDVLRTFAPESSGSKTGSKPAPPKPAALENTALTPPGST